MITQTMNDSEKYFEAFRVVRKAYSLYEKVLREVAERFARGTRFPYYIHYDFEDNGNNWRLLFFCRSKEHKRKKLFMSMAYTTYTVEKRKKDGNCGKGILFFSPRDLYNYVETKDPDSIGFTVIADITPHAINRYTERYLRPRGMELSLDKKVENILYRWRWFDINGDFASQKYSKDTITAYDVFMKDGGVLRGQILNNICLRFFTYISDDMLFDNQRETQENMMKEYMQLKREGMKI